MSSLKERLDKIQTQVLKRTNQFLKTYDSGYIAMPTGTGKTRTACKIIKSHLKENPKAKILWVTTMQELIQQTREDLLEFFNQPIGHIQQKTFDIQTITTASINSLKEDRLAKLKPNTFSLIIVDECHHAPSDLWKNPIDYFSAKKIGLTPVPWRNDGKQLSTIFTQQIFNLPYQTSIKEKLIAEGRHKIILTNSTLKQIKTKYKDYSIYEYEHFIKCPKRNKIIVDSYVDHIRPELEKLNLKKKTICFAINVNHLKELLRLFRKRNITAQPIYSEHPERNSVYREFKYGDEIEVLIAVDILNEGKNIPDTTCTLHTRPTRSLGLYINQVGRATRFIENQKEKHLIVNYFDVNSEYAFLEQYVGTVSRSENKTDFIVEYYKGDDWIQQINHITNYKFSKKLDSIKQNWTHNSIFDACKQFLEKNKKLRKIDLTPKNNLPSAYTVRLNYVGSTDQLFKDLGLKQRLTTKEEVSEALKTFWKDNNYNIKITDLGVRNQLPSQKIIYKHWKTWSNCCKELGFTTHRRLSNLNINTQQQALKAIRSYVKTNNLNSLSFRNLDKIKELPSREKILELFKTYNKFKDEYKKKYKEDINKNGFNKTNKKLNKKQINYILENKNLSARQRAKHLNVSHSTVLKYLKENSTD